MRKFLIALLFWTGTAVSADLVDEIYMKNESGGEIVLTVRDCPVADWVKQGFPHQAYATEGNGTKHEGCWVRPEILDAPANAFGIVTTIWEDNIRMEYPDYLFKPKTVVIKVPPIIVTPDNGI